MENNDKSLSYKIAYVSSEDPEYIAAELLQPTN